VAEIVFRYLVYDELFLIARLKSEVRASDRRSALLFKATAQMIDPFEPIDSVHASVLRDREQAEEMG